MSISRREFINLTTLTSSGLILGVFPLACNDKKLNNVKASYDSPFLKISARGEVQIITPVPEIGQGVRKSIPLLVAEELDLDFSKIKVVQGEASEELGGMAAAGSNSIVNYYSQVRRAGAIAREMLRSAAAMHWKVKTDQVGISNGMAFLKSRKSELKWEELLHMLIDMPVPQEVTLKPRSEYLFSNKTFAGPDLVNIVEGKAKFGIDIRLEGMKYAVIARCPTYGGKVKSFDDSAAKLVNGVVKIAEVEAKIPGQNKYAQVLGGIAVVANNTWAAIKGREALRIEWDMGPNADGNSADIKPSLSAAATVLRETGSVANVISESDVTLESTYELPIMAHACMEPMNYTAHVEKDKAYLTGPTQRPRMIQDYVSAVFKIPINNVRVIPTLSGGGFGRRLAIDYALEAAIISRDMGFPVKVVWTREDDIVHDYFRSAAIHKLKGTVSKNLVTSWTHRIHSQPIGNGAIYEVQGAADIPINVPNIDISWGPLKSGIRIGSWRSVSHSFNSYVVNSWIDELAEASGQDFMTQAMKLLGQGEGDVAVQLPLRGRRGNVVTNLGRIKTVIRMASEMSDWGVLSRPGEGMGMAFAVYKNSYAAHVCKLKVEDRKVELIKIFAVLDCGEVVDIAGIKAQMEGAIMDGIATVFFNEITYQNGQVVENNFDQLKWPRMRHMPEIKLKVVNSKEGVSGAGEPPYPSVAPAIANAIYDACGVRLFKLPAKHHNLKLN